MQTPKASAANGRPPGILAALAGTVGWGLLANFAEVSHRRIQARHMELKCSIELHERLRAVDCLPAMRTALEKLKSLEEERAQRLARYNSRLDNCLRRIRG